MDQIVMALTSKHAVAIGLYSHVQYTFSCSPLVADSQLSCKFKPSQDSLRQDEYKRQPPEWHGLLVDQDLYQNATVDPSKTMPARLEKVNYSVIDEILSFSTYVNVMGICFWSHHSLSNTNSVCDPCTLTFYTM